MWGSLGPWIPHPCSLNLLSTSFICSFICFNSELWYLEKSLPKVVRGKLDINRNSKLWIIHFGRAPYLQSTCSRVNGHRCQWDTLNATYLLSHKLAVRLRLNYSLSSLESHLLQTNSKFFKIIFLLIVTEVEYICSFDV